jgi:copper chaperone
MIAYEVKDMSCAHCVNAITKAVAAVDPAATVRIDLAAHRIEIDGASADPQRLRAAIEEAGYTPVPA